MFGQFVGVWLGCSGPVACPPPELLGHEVPANVPALPVGTRRQSSDGGSGSVEREDGGAVAADFSAPNVFPPVAVLTLAQPLEPGAGYVLRHDCGAGYEPREAFTAGPARPLPTKTGLLKVTESGRKVVSVNGGPACVSDVDAAFATLQITPDPALVPFLAVAKWRLEIDGTAIWASRDHGGVAADGTIARSVLSRRMDLVHSACGNANADLGIAAGYHVARLKAELVGGPTLEPAEAEFTLDCSGLAAGGRGCSCGAASPGLLGLLALAGWAWRRVRACSAPRSA